MKTIVRISLISVLVLGINSSMNAEPSNAVKIKAKPIFTTPIVWAGNEEPPDPDSAALLHALPAFETDVKAGISALESFVASHPESMWNPSLHVHLAEYYRKLGRYSLALAHWETAWNGTKDATDSASKELAARTAAGWTRLLASLGRKQQLGGLFDEIAQRGLDKTAHAFTLQATRDGLEMMKAKPDVAYRCGSIALGRVMQYLQPESNSWRQVIAAASPDEGFRMSDLTALAATNGFEVLALQRSSGNEIVVPSVVHWKLEHYAAIVEKQGDSYLVVDSTFRDKKWMEADVVNAEASGYFVVAATNAPAGWKVLTTEEASLVRGKGYPNDINDEEDGEEDDGCPPPPPPETGDGPGAGQGEGCEDGSENSGDASSIVAGDGVWPPGTGMPRWRVSEPYISLWLIDSPLFYRSSSGKPMALTLKYNHRGVSRGANIGGFGDKWECDWLGFLEKPAGAPENFKNFQCGGGVLSYPTNGDMNFKTGGKLSVVTANAVYAIKTPRARERRFGYPLAYGDGTVRLFLTNRMDQYDRIIHYGYASYTNGSDFVVRLTSMTDQDGKQCTLDYTNATLPGLITSVTDPYSRTAHFFYDDEGRLTNITDMAGMVSSFQYDTTGAITNMTTPYGDTSFRYFSGTNSLCTLNRAIEITEPTGAKQLYAYRDRSPSGIGSFHSFDGYDLNIYRNSFHWNRQQYAALSETARTNVLDMPVEDYQRASVKHWLHGLEVGESYTVIGTLAASAGPLVNTNDTYRVNMVALAYPDQGGYQWAGSSASPNTVWWGGGVNKLEIARNAWRRPEQFTFYRDGGYVTQIYSNEFNADGRILKRVWGPEGELVRGYGFDSTRTNLLTSVTNALGEVIRYTHNAGGQVTSITHPSGLVTTNFYDSFGFLKTNIDTGFRTNYYTYSNGNCVSHTNELGLVRTMLHDSLNRLTSISYPDGTTISNIYDKLDLVATKDRLGNWTRYVYNAVRQMTARTNANGHVTLFDYCDCGSPSEITELNGSSPVVTQYSYDIAGRRTNVTYADGYSQSYVYSGDTVSDSGGGRPIRVEDSSGLAVHFGYGDFWALSSVLLTRLPDVTPDAFLMQRTFDKYGRVSQTIDRNGVVVTNGYDILGRLTNRVVIDPATLSPRGTNAFVYTARGLTNSIDELGNKTWFVHDSAGRLLYQTNANSEVLQFTYNPSDQLLTLKDGKNQQTSWNYDEYGRVTNKLDATSTEIFRYEYDPNDQLTNRWTREKGDTHYRYDVVGLLTNVDYPGTVMDIALTYDGLDRLTNIVDAIGTTKFAYTDAGQLLSEDGPWASDTVSYTYSARRRASMSVLQPNASAWTQSYAYDHYDRLTNVTSAAGSFGHTYLDPYVNFQYYISDRVRQLGLPGEANEHTYIQSEFDEQARLTNSILWKSSTVLNQHAYQLNDANQRTRQTFTGGNYVDYTYDNIGQLKTAKGWESDTTTARLQEKFGYAYDAAWNLQRRTNNALVQTFGVNNRNELTNATRSGTLTVAGLASQPGANLDHVAVSGTGLSAGNADVYADGSWARTGATLADGTNSYTATAEDITWPTPRTAQDSVTVNLPATLTFQYDGNGNLTNDGRRVFEYDCENQLTNVYVASAWRSAFQYDAFGRRRVRKEYTWQSSAWVLTNEVRYVYDAMLVVQERDGNNLALVSYTRGDDLSGSRQGAGGIGGLLARTDNALLYAPGASPSSHAYYHADGGGNITAIVDTNGFIVARYHYDSYGNLLGMVGPLAEANTYRFSSKEWHANSGLCYYGFRYYEPNLQRWLNRDPIEEAGGINLYGIVHNNTVNLIDSFGLSIVTNSTPRPVPVSGGGGTGSGHEGGGAEIFVVVPPGGVCGGSANAMPGYGTREEALQAYFLPQITGALGGEVPKSKGNLHDVDYVDNAEGPHNPKHADNKIRGDDIGPTFTIHDDRSMMWPGVWLTTRNALSAPLGERIHARFRWLVTLLPDVPAPTNCYNGIPLGY